jgi:WD40 repeat protein
VRVWSLEDKRERYTFGGHAGDVLALALSSDGRTVASGGRDRTVKLWDLPANKGRLTLKGHEDAVTSLAFSPDGALLVSGAGGDRFKAVYRGELRLWDVATGRLLAELRGHSDGVSAVAFAPDGKAVASAGRDRTVRLWDVSAFAGRAAAPAP